MKIVFIGLLIIGLLILSTIFIDANANLEQTRAYFKVKDENVKNIYKDVIKHELKDNIISIETSLNNINTLKQSKDLEFIEYVPVFEIQASRSVDIKRFKVVFDQPSRDDIFKRDCKLTDFGLPQINYGVKYMYEDSSLIKTEGGKNVKVAVLDTGVNKSHPDLTRRIKYCKDFTSNPAIDSCEDTSTIPGGHGTLVASIIGADSGPDGLGMFGMAPEVDLYVINACRGSFCFEDDVVAALYEAENQNVNIISMSFGGFSPTSNLRNAIDYAYTNNILLVASSGNWNGDPSLNIDTIFYPAAFQQVIAVGAIREDYTIWPKTARGINDNDYIIEEREVEFGVPGTVIMGASKTGCYTFGTGTSLATPHVTGLAAKLWDGNAISTRDRMQLSARFHDLHVPGDDTATGFGMPTVNIPRTPPLKQNPPVYME